MSRIKKKNTIFTNSILYTIGNLLLKAFSFFLIPIYTAYLSTEEYGIVNLSSGFYNIVSSILMLGLQYAVVRYYADYKDNREKVAKIFGTTICIVFSLGILFILLCFAVRKDICNWFFDGLNFYPIVFLSIIISITSALYIIYQDILKGMQNAKSSMILSYVYFFLQIACNLFTVIVLKKGAVGILTSTFLVNFIMLIIMFVDLIKRKMFIIGIDIEILRRLLCYSLPLLPHTIAYNLSNYATKLIITTNLSLSVLGLYGLASQFGNVSDIVLNSVQSAFQPWMYGILIENKSNKCAEIAKVTYFLMWLYGLIYILIGSFSEEAILIMTTNKDYVCAWNYVPFIVFSISLKSPLYFYQNFLYYDKSKTKFIFVSTLAGSLVNILLTWLLVPVWQVMGSIVADSISMFIRLLITIYIVRNEAKRFYSIAKIELISLVPMFFMLVGVLPSYIWYKDVLSLKNILIKLAVVISYILFIGYLNRNIIKDKFAQIKYSKLKIRGD